MVHIELSSRGRDTIALEMPDISYFSTNRSGGLEENCWEAENKLLTYRISDFRCRDFNVTRYQIYCKEDCCMRSLNVGNSFMGLSVVRQGIVECFLSETRDKRIWRKGYTNMIVSSGIKEERNLFRKGDTFGMTSILCRRISSNICRNVIRSTSGVLICDSAGGRLSLSLPRISRFQSLYLWR